jgi:hypothetical protein
MHNTKQFFNVLCILFSFCFISCINKKTQTTEFENAEINNTRINDTGKTEEIERNSEGNELQDNETDIFQGDYIFSSIEILECENKDSGKYTELDETAYIRMIKINKRYRQWEYKVETNCWFLENLLRNDVIEYPNITDDWNKFNYNERFDNRFYQYAAEGFDSGIYIDFFYTGTGIVLHYIKWDREYEEDSEKIDCYIYFDKKNAERYKVYTETAARKRTAKRYG